MPGDVQTVQVGAAFPGRDRGFSPVPCSPPTDGSVIVRHTLRTVKVPLDSAHPEIRVLTHKLTEIDPDCRKVSFQFIGEM